MTAAKTFHSDLVPTMPDLFADYEGPLCRDLSGAAMPPKEEPLSQPVRATKAVLPMPVTAFVVRPRVVPRMRRIAENEDR